MELRFGFEPICFEPPRFEPVCFELVERLICSEPPELIEWAVALEARGARAAVELEAPCSRHNPGAVVESAARWASARFAQDEPVRSGEARDGSARSALYEKARRCGAVSGSREVAHWARLSARYRWASCVERILRWQSNVQYHWGNTENRWGIVVDILDRFSFQPHLW